MPVNLVPRLHLQQELVQSNPEIILAALQEGLKFNNKAGERAQTRLVPVLGTSSATALCGRRIWTEGQPPTKTLVQVTIFAPHPFPASLPPARPV